MCAAGRSPNPTCSLLEQAGLGQLQVAGPLGGILFAADDGAGFYLDLCHLLGVDQAVHHSAQGHCSDQVPEHCAEQHSRLHDSPCLANYAAIA